LKEKGLEMGRIKKLPEKIKKQFKKKIYDEKEYRFKLLLKNEYSYLINNNISNEDSRKRKT
jgi:hypothetical protein